MFITQNCSALLKNHWSAFPPWKYSRSQFTKEKSACKAAVWQSVLQGAECHVLCRNVSRVGCLKKKRRQIFSKDKNYYCCSQMWFWGTICLRVGIFFSCICMFMIEHLLGNIWHELFLFLPKFHGFVLYLRRILQKVIWCLIPIGVVMVLTFELLPWNRRKGGEPPFAYF